MDTDLGVDAYNEHDEGLLAELVKIYVFGDIEALNFVLASGVNTLTLDHLKHMNSVLLGLRKVTYPAGSFGILGGYSDDGGSQTAPLRLTSLRFDCNNAEADTDVVEALAGLNFPTALESLALFRCGDYTDRLVRAVERRLTSPLLSCLRGSR